MSEISNFLISIAPVSVLPTMAPGLAILNEGYEIATDASLHGHVNHEGLIYNRKDIWSPEGIEAITTIMNPRMYYQPLAFSTPLTTRTHWHRPVVEYTHIKRDADTGEWSESTFKETEYFTDGTTDGGKIRVIATATGGYSRVGFVSRNHVGLDAGSVLQSYPGMFNAFDESNPFFLTEPVSF